MPLLQAHQCAVLFSKAHPSAHSPACVFWLGCMECGNTLLIFLYHHSVSSSLLFFSTALSYNHVLHYGRRNPKIKLTEYKTQLPVALSLTRSPCWVKNSFQLSPPGEALHEIQLPRILQSWHPMWFSQTGVSSTTHSHCCWLQRIQRDGARGFDKPIPIHRYMAGKCLCIYSSFCTAHSFQTPVLLEQPGTEAGWDGSRRTREAWLKWFYK